jgi:pimeloyl-ACP methyl ester carboxylesterase
MRPWAGRRVCGALAALATGLAAIALAVPAAAQPATFEAGACDLPAVTAELATRLRCGTVAVPRDHARPEAGSFRLAVVIIAPADGAATPDPVLFLEGGPGSPLTDRAARIAGAESRVLAPHRTLVLLDQRASGRSEPALCPGLALREVRLIGQNPAPEDFAASWRVLVQGCRQSITAQGLDPVWFGTNVTVEDIESVRNALGIARWSVYARSYGTTVAMALMARHPETLRAVVLDSVYPPDPLPRTRDQTFSAALARLFAACDADPACSALHPDLASQYRETMQRLRAFPLQVDLRSVAGAGRLAFGPVAFASLVNMLLYYPPLLAQIPNVIQAAQNGDLTAIQPLIAHVVVGYALSSAGTAFAVECRDRAPPPDPQGAAGERTLVALTPGSCRIWNTVASPPPLPHDTSVPTLLLSGGLDPVTPPDFATLAATAMGPRAVLVVFPTRAHDIEEFTPCGAGLITRFIGAPDAALDGSCAAKVPPVRLR